MDARKRRRPEGVTDGNDGLAAAKRFRESDFNQPGLGSKSKPCTKFFSTAGCPFGEGCHFLHYVPGGYNSVSQMMNYSNPAMVPAGRNVMPSVPSPAVKIRMCNKYNTNEGCKFGDKCHFAHGERELGKPITSLHNSQMTAPVGGRLPLRMEPPPAADLAATASFGVSATAKISVDATLSSAIIGKGGMNTKHICHSTGVKLAIREHEYDPNLRNIELEGTFDQIKHASAMVRELLVNLSTSPAVSAKNVRAPGGSGNNFKTKICDNFAKGTCTFGEKCHFAHGETELRKTNL